MAEQSSTIEGNAINGRVCDRCKSAAPSHQAYGCGLSYCPFAEPPRKSTQPVKKVIACESMAAYFNSEACRWPKCHCRSYDGTD